MEKGKTTTVNIFICFQEILCLSFKRDGKRKIAEETKRGKVN